MKNVPLFKKINRCVSEANEELSMKKLLKKTLKLILPIVLGGFILFWVYHNFDFTKVGEVLLHGTNWWWMFFRYYSGCSHRCFAAGGGSRCWSRWKLSRKGVIV